MNAVLVLQGTLVRQLHKGLKKRKNTLSKSEETRARGVYSVQF